MDALYVRVKENAAHVYPVITSMIISVIPIVWKLQQIIALILRQKYVDQH